MLEEDGKLEPRVSPLEEELDQEELEKLDQEVAGEAGAEPQLESGEVEVQAGSDAGRPEGNVDRDRKKHNKEKRKKDKGKKRRRGSESDGSGPEGSDDERRKRWRKIVKKKHRNRSRSRSRSGEKKSGQPPVEPDQKKKLDPNSTEYWLELRKQIGIE